MNLCCMAREKQSQIWVLSSLAFSARKAIMRYYTSLFNRAALKKQSRVLTRSFYFHFGCLITLQNKHSNDCKWVPVYNNFSHFNSASISQHYDICKQTKPNTLSLLSTLHLISSFVADLIMYTFLSGIHIQSICL